MEAQDEVDPVNDAESNVKEGPQVLRVDVPSVLQNGSELVQDPTECVDGEAHLVDTEPRGIPLRHEQYVEEQQDDKLDDFHDVPGPRHNQPVLVQQAGRAGVIERNGLLLVPVWNDVHEAAGCVNDAAFVDGVNDLLAARRAEEQLTLAQDGDLEGRQGVGVVPVGSLGGLAADVFGGILEGFEAGDQDVGEDEQTLGAVVVLIEAPQDARGDELAQGGAGEVDILAVVEV